MKSRAALAIVVPFSLATACGGAQSSPTTATSSDPAAGSAPRSGQTPSCDAVVAHVKQLSIAASGATTDDQKDAAAREVEPALVDLADECEGGNGAAGWSPTFRSCVLAAKNREDVAVCDQANASASEASP